MKYVLEWKEITEFLSDEERASFIVEKGVESYLLSQHSEEVEVL